jgi:hypothetical protein
MLTSFTVFTIFIISMIFIILVSKLVFLHERILDYIGDISSMMMEYNQLKYKYNQLIRELKSLRSNRDVDI